MREVDGRELAAIGITVEAAGEAEAESTEDVGESGFEVDLTRTAHGSLELEGELLWDVASGHFVSLEHEGSIEIRTIEAGSGDFDGREFEQEVVVAFEGEVSFSFAASAPE
jgi:hypothetical protein